MDTKEMSREQQPPRRPRPEGGTPERKRPQNPERSRRPAENRKSPREQTEEPVKRPRAAAPQRENRKKRPVAVAAARPPQGAARKKPMRPGKEPDDTLSSKRRAYGNSKPKKKTAINVMGDVFKQTANRTAEKAKVRKEERAKKKHGNRPQVPTPAVIYTQPEAFNRSRFLVQIITVVAVVLALVLGMSVFFKVKTITVKGAEVYSAWAVREASGINEGDNLMSFGNARAAARIRANLPYVKTVRLGIKLPDTVNIMIEEENVVYSIKDSSGIWWLMTSDGKVVEQSVGGKAANHTQILGVSLDNPVPNEKAVALENVPTETNEDGELVPVAVTGTHRLNAALVILQALEDNDIVGDAASVDVSQIEDIVLWYGSRYQVKLGDASRLAEKIAFMNDVILQMSDYQSGILDISFTIWPDKVGYTPFS